MNSSAHRFYGKFKRKDSKEPCDDEKATKRTKSLCLVSENWLRERYLLQMHNSSYALRYLRIQMRQSYMTTTVHGLLKANFKRGVLIIQEKLTALFLPSTSNYLLLGHFHCLAVNSLFSALTGAETH